MKFSATGRDLTEFANIMASLNKLKSKKFRQVKFISIHGNSIAFEKYFASTICHILTYACPTITSNPSSILRFDSLKLKGKTYTIPSGIRDMRFPDNEQMKDFPDAIRLKDDNNIEYGCVINNIVFIYFDLPHRLSTSLSSEDFIEMASIVMQSGLDKAIPFTANERKLYAMKMFFKTGGNWVERKIKQLDEQISYNIKDQKNYERKLVEYTRNIMLMNAQINSLRQIDFREQIFGCVDRISKMDKVVKIDFTTDNFIIHTKPIILNYNGRKYCLGRYKIIYNLNGSLHIVNKDKLKSCHYDHPHIRGGVCCLGNIADILKLIGTFNYDASTSILIRYLESYKANDSYIKLPDFMCKAFSHKVVKKSKLPISGSTYRIGGFWMTYGRSDD